MNRERNFILISVYSANSVYSGFSFRLSVVGKIFIFVEKCNIKGNPEVPRGSFKLVRITF